MARTRRRRRPGWWSSESKSATWPHPSQIRLGPGDSEVTESRLTIMPVIIGSSWSDSDDHRRDLRPLAAPRAAPSRYRDRNRRNGHRWPGPRRVAPSQPDSAMTRMPVSEPGLRLSLGHLDSCHIRRRRSPTVSHDVRPHLRNHRLDLRRRKLHSTYDIARMILRTTINLRCRRFLQLRRSYPIYRRSRSELLEVLCRMFGQVQVVYDVVGHLKHTPS